MFFFVKTLVKIISRKRGHKFFKKIFFFHSCHLFLLLVVPGPPHLDDLLQELHLQGLLLHVQQPQGEGEGEAQELEGGSSGGSGGELEGGFVGGGDYDEVD